MEITPRRKFGWGKAVRVRKHAQFCRIQSKGRRFGGEFVLAICSFSQCGHVRHGLTVSKRVGNAVTRNRVKRRLRSILRLHPQTFSACDIVWIAKTNAACASYRKMESDILRIADRVSRFFSGQPVDGKL